MCSLKTNLRHFCATPCSFIFARYLLVYVPNYTVGIYVGRFYICFRLIIIIYNELIETIYNGQTV